MEKLYNKFIYSFLFDYNKERVTNILITFFGIIGFIWTIIECSTWIFSESKYPQDLKDFIRENINISLILIFLLSVIRHRRKLKIEKKFSNTDLKVIVEFCDIFKQKGAIIIPVSDTFDNDIPNGLVNKKTVHGQFIEKFYSSNIGTLNSEITRNLQLVGAIPIETNNNLKGNKVRYDIGTACSIKPSNDKYFYLSALSFMKETGNVEMRPEYLYDFLSKTWDFIPNHGEYHDTVNIPVIGTGLHRLPANHTNQFIVNEIVNSFFVTSKVQTFCKTLRICLYHKNYKLYNFENLNILFCHIDNYLNR
ncbi:DUF6430 domain-containing protein [Flavobacterium sp. CFBP9031]|uniref:macro domain-containing protein n=1 Tax=Flavobacterium sp. CFBP9031 TaxID=3096538 RepID=UPI002A6AD3F3|nr:macro domain-containing protein [Flavobacterium sp. CFBP9031]MDY0990468.1 DUF6430 domain-containing protein [Flavobacterium sp. CFBP9031]